MTLLRQGITGFDVEGAVDVRRFKQAVYAAAQTSGATVGNFAPTEEATPNFHEVELDYLGRALSILCHRNFPIVAIVKRPIDMSGVQPVDISALAAVLEEAGFEIAPAAELDRALKREDYDVLSAPERRQVKYWQPKRVGQLVFNWWD